MSCSPSLSFSPSFTVPLTPNSSPSQTPHSHDANYTLAIPFNLIGQEHQCTTNTQSLEALTEETQQALEDFLDKVKKDIEEIETINIELDHRVSKLIAENEHLKQTYKKSYYTIKPAREQRLVTTALKNDLRKLKGKALAKNVNSLNSSDPSPSCTPTKVEVPKKLPKLSMVNTSLKKLKYHLTGFDKVVKERTTAIAITEGMWGFEHTKACFRDKIIPFVKTLKDIFNNFDQYLIDELTEVQNVFKQMEHAVEQHRLESKTFEVRMNQVLHENERLLEQVINTDIVNVVVNYSVDNASVNVHECEKCLKLETELLNNKDFIEKETYYKLLKSFTTYEKHCISLEVDTQLNQEIFQRDNSDTVIQKLKEKIKSLSGNVNEDKVKKDIEEIETINIELDHRVSKLIAENEHLKQTYKKSYYTIKPAREQGLVTTALKNDLRKLKGKALAKNVVTKHTIDPNILKINGQPLAPIFLNNRTSHSDYLKHTQEQAAILKEIGEQGKS
ncbi:hypothetical protein Tco_0467673 [Tanacetum coccineum]